MHLLSAQAGAIQQEGEAIDLAQSPGALIFASAADSELAMLAAAADRAGETELRLANTLRLSHNLSVDLWLDQTVQHARLVVLRLIGGIAYFQYGVDELTALCANQKIPLVLLPGDANPDPILQSRSTIHPDDWQRLHALLIAGGPENADTLLEAFNLLATPSSPRPSGEGSATTRPGEGGLLASLTPTPFARFGLWHPALGMTDEAGLRTTHAAMPPKTPAGSSPSQGEARWGSETPSAYIPILFYRAALEGAGTATITALIAELERQHLAPVPILVSSLKEAPCTRFVQNALTAFPPAAIFNLTGFALGLDSLDAKANPFATTDAPVIQLIQSGRSEAQWLADPQGLSSKDMAMFLVMPELDGRLAGLIVGHKADAVWHDRCQVPLTAYTPDQSGITRAVTFAANWSRLRTTTRAERKIALVLANYPIRDGRLANGVGYDAPQSTVEMLKALDGAGYTLSPSPSPLRGGVRGGGSSFVGFTNARLARQPKNITRAREMRGNPTPFEQKLWSMLRQLNSQGHHFRRQVPIGRYFADFASHELRLIVEVDGDTHGTDAAARYDRARSAYLMSAGYRVVRVTNFDVATNPEGVWHVVTEAIDATGTPTPNPSPQGGGGSTPLSTDPAAPSPPSLLRGGIEGGGSAPPAYPQSSTDLITLLQSGPTNANPSRGSSPATLPLARYRALFATLPPKIQSEVATRWGDPATDPFVRETTFHLPALIFGNIAILLQPARSYHLDETTSYHDPALVPPHAYLAAYLWLRHEFGAHALIHNGKHGTLEWLPGKAAALDAASYPDALWGQLPHFYPFIVNDPGEGTQAKRRTGAVIIDHLVPPLTRAETYGPLKDLEALLDEYYAAAGMDRRRLADLRRRILDFTRDARLDRDIGLPEDETAALIKIDNFLCDLKEAQIRDGLHIFGRSPQGDLERDLTVALARVPRGDNGGENSLIRALADDLKLGFDPLTVKLGTPWTGPTPTLTPSPLWGGNEGGGPRTLGDVVEHLENLAAGLVDGALTAPPDWHATRAVLATITDIIRPRLAASGPAELRALLDGLDGKFIAPGPSGAPSRGRLDVLPTGRNFYSVDNRAVPTPTAWELGKKSAESLVLRHFQDHGTYLKSVALSVWGTANMRTGGDDIAQALALIGARPTWDPSSLRVSGYEIIPLPRLNRPRVDVTLRISGFFRDAFPAQIALFDRAIRAIGALDEPTDDNPIAARMRTDALGLMAEGNSERDAALTAGHRIFGSKPGTYGAGLSALIDSGTWTSKADLANQALDWGQYAYGAQAAGTPARARFAARLSDLDAVIHNQDNREHDLLDSDNYYQFEGGLAAAADLLGAQPAVYHNDHSRPERPLIKTLEEEISFVMRSRVVNPKWLDGVRRHGYKGAFEIIATLDFMFAFAATTGAVKTHHFDLAFEAFVEDAATRDFIKQNNHFGYDELIAKFNEARERGLWTPRSNSAYALLEETP